MGLIFPGTRLVHRTLLRVNDAGRAIIGGTVPVRVLALASQKGGSGKTTLSGHLSVQAQRAGAGPVVLMLTPLKRSWTTTDISLRMS